MSLLPVPFIPSYGPSVSLGGGGSLCDLGGVTPCPSAVLCPVLSQVTGPSVGFQPVVSITLAQAGSLLSRRTCAASSLS